MADGSVCQRGPKSFQIGLCLAVKDLHHVEKFRDFLKSKHKICFPPSSKNPMYSIKSNQIAEDLGKFGVVPNKTFTAKTNYLELNRHFWRGVIDGDGHIGVIRKSGKPRLELWGSYNLMVQFREFIRFLDPSCKADVRPAKSIYRIQLSGKFALMLIQELYGGCTVSLDRKNATAINMLQIGQKSLGQQTLTRKVEGAK